MLPIDSFGFYSFAPRLQTSNVRSSSRPQKSSSPKPQDLSFSPLKTSVSNAITYENTPRSLLDSSFVFPLSARPSVSSSAATSTQSPFKYSQNHSTTTDNYYNYYNAAYPPTPRNSRINSLSEYSYSTMSPSQRLSISFPNELSSSEDEDDSYSDEYPSDDELPNSASTPTPIATPTPHRASFAGSKPAPQPLSRPRAHSLAKTVKCQVKSKLKSPSDTLEKYTPLNTLGKLKPTPTSRFLFSSSTYSVSAPIPYKKMSRLITETYGGEVRISKKRNQGRDDTTLNNFKSSQNTDAFPSPPSSPRSTPESCSRRGSKTDQLQQSRKGLQGRPFSIEMDLDLVFPTDLDDLYYILYSKGIPQESHKVKLLSSYTGKQGTLVQKLSNGTIKPYVAKKTSGTRRVPKYNIFSDSLAMVQNYRPNATGFSLVTPIRQSSTQRSDSKSGTCPVVKFTITPVTDFTVQFLKRMAYPRYKADMKIYVIPILVPEQLDFYTSAAMFLQDQKYRLDMSMPFDTESKVFFNKTYKDLPNAVYSQAQLEEEEAIVDETMDDMDPAEGSTIEMDSSTEKPKNDEFENTIIKQESFDELVPDLDLNEVPPSVVTTISVPISQPRRPAYKPILPKPRLENRLSPSPAPYPIRLPTSKRVQHKTSTECVKKAPPAPKIKTEKLAKVATSILLVGFASSTSSHSTQDKPGSKTNIGFILN